MSRLLKSAIMNYCDGEVLQGGTMSEGDLVLHYFGGHFVQGDHVLDSKQAVVQKHNKPRTRVAHRAVSRN